MRPRPLIPHVPALLFVGATLGFGIGNVLAKVILNRGVKALELLPIRYASALVGLVAVLAATGRLRRLDRATWKKGSLIGALNMAVPSILINLGLEHLSASVSRFWSPSCR